MMKLKKDGTPKLSGGSRKGAGAPKKARKKQSVTVCVYDVEKLKELAKGL
jgi:hypothetical protein